MTDINKLRELAVRALPFAPGEWFVENGIDQVRDCANDFVCETGEDDPIKASFIAAANPKTVLALLDEIDRLKAENDRLRQGMKGDYDIDAWLEWTREKDRIKAQNDALQGALHAVQAEVDGNLRPLTATS
ncbi:ead/Ea22-like family protein [Pseudomonas aeruginosa]